MIPKEQETKILRLHNAEKWRVGTIARELGVHRDVVTRVLAQAGFGRSARSRRPSMIDPFVPFIQSTFEQYPRMAASTLYRMVCERGYPGRQDHFRHMVAQYRPRRSVEAFLRLRTLPGEQAQVDWAHFGPIRIGTATYTLSAFVMVLSWSRALYFRFFLNQRMENFLRGHEAAFRAFGGVPRTLLFDNLKSVVLERDGSAIRLNPKFLTFAAHYQFETRPVGVRKGNEKGRVERAIRYIREGFYMGRSWTDIDHLNAQAEHWCRTTADERDCPEDRTMKVRQAIETERPTLLGLPDNPYDTDERVEVRVAKTPYVRFDRNDYSVPHTHVRCILTVKASLTTVRVIDALEVVAEHPRNFSVGEVIEQREHVAALLKHKHRAKRHSATDRLRTAVPVTEQLLLRLSERGGNIGACVNGLMRLLERHGPVELEEAVREALVRDSPHLNAVRLVLDRRLRERNTPPPLAVELPDDPKVKNLVVRPHDLAGYDNLNTEADDDDGQ